MVDVVRNGKRAKSRFRKEAWVKALLDIQGAAYRLDVITSDKIKNKLNFLMQRWEVWTRSKKQDDVTQFFLAEEGLFDSEFLFK